MNVSPTGDQPWLLGLVGLAVALGAYPIVRRLTQRLERLQRGVERWGQGDLSARLPVSGQDEVAFLAERFNAAAERVQTLMLSHKTLLANASHELRSPLARIRIGLELLGNEPARAPQRAEIVRNIDELDQLIDEILMASRLDLRDANEDSALGPTEEVDLVGLAAEECARTGADLDVAEGISPVLMQGYPKLLRRLLRNLLENARRSGHRPEAGGAVEPVRLAIDRITAPGGQARVRVSVEDHGPGVPPELRERIFEPFYRLPGASESVGGVGLGLSLVRSIDIESLMRAPPPHPRLRRTLSPCGGEGRSTALAHHSNSPSPPLRGRGEGEGGLRFSPTVATGRRVPLLRKRSVYRFS